MSPPVSIKVPTAGRSSRTIVKRGKETTIELFPPVEKKASFFYVVRDYTTTDGLSIDELFGSAIDKNGNLWFATDGSGVSSYDGAAFTNYLSAGGGGVVVYTVMQDRAGNLWFCTQNGASRYDGLTATVFTTADGLANNRVKSIYEDSQGFLWFGTEGGVSRFDGKSFTNYTTAQGLINDSVTSVAEDSQGNLWFGTQGGVSKFNGTTFTSYTEKEGLVNNSILAIRGDHKGIIWFATEKGVSKYDGSSFVNYTQDQGLADNYVWTVFEDRKGKLWFGTKRGASQFDGNTLINYSEEITKQSIRGILEDKTGNIWFSTDGGGIVRYDGKAFKHYTADQGLGNNYVRGILEDQYGNLWMSTHGGVSKYNGKTFTNYTESQGLPYGIVRGLFEDRRGNLWFGTDEGGVSKFDGISFTTYTKAQGIPFDDVRSIIEDREGNIWFGTYGGGASKFDGKTFTNYTTEQGLVNNYVASMLEDRKGNIWFGTAKGFSKFDGHVFTTYHYAEEGESSDHFISGIFEDKKGNLWISAQGKGVLRYDGNSFITFTTKQGLPDNHPYGTIATKEQNIFIGTNQGFAIITEFVPTPFASQHSESELGKISAVNSMTNEELVRNYVPVVEVYNAKNGYPVYDFNAGENNIFLAKNGMIWFGTGTIKSGLISFDYDELHKNYAPPEVVIKGVKINNEKVSWSELETGKSDSAVGEIPSAEIEETLTFGRVLSEKDKIEMRRKFGGIAFNGLSKFNFVPQNLVLPYGYNNITFDFAAVEPARPENVRYQYKLEGYRKNWSVPSHTTQANFGNIYEGSYTFHLRAQSPFGVWSEPVTYTFTVLPPFYRSYFAYGLYAIAIPSLLYAILLWRTAALRKNRKKLEKIIQKRITEIVAEKKMSEELVLNILPHEVAEELKLTGSVKPKLYEMATILFTDFKNFTGISEVLSAEELVGEIDHYFKAFDQIVSRYPIEKIKTIGDSYMLVGGLPVTNNTHAKDVVNAGLDFIDAVEKFKEEYRKKGMPIFEVRVGVNTGSLVSGIVGSKKFAYDIWGDAVNMASFMESGGEAGKVNISATTYELIKNENEFTFTYRGKLETKDGRKVDMYFVERKKN